MKNLSEIQIKSVKDYIEEYAIDLTESKDAEFEEQDDNNNTIVYQLSDFDYYISEERGGEPDEILQELHAISIDVTAYTYNEEGEEIGCASGSVLL